jgi:hypothetical protein
MASNRPNDRRRELKAKRREALETGMNRAKRRAAARAALKAAVTEKPASEALKAKGRKKSKAEKVSETTPEPVGADGFASGPHNAETHN